MLNGASLCPRNATAKAWLSVSTWPAHELIDLRSSQESRLASDRRKPYASKQGESETKYSEQADSDIQTSGVRSVLTPGFRVALPRACTPAWGRAAGKPPEQALTGRQVPAGPRDGVCVDVCPSGTRPAGAFLSSLSLGMQRKGLGRVTQVGAILETLIRARNEPRHP
jgi:hypothetical protein